MTSRTRPQESGGILELLKTVVYALLIAGVFRTVLYQPFYIPSGSMKSTLLIGDFLFVNKFVYGFSQHSCPFSLCPFSGRILPGEPVRGDVIVFRHPVSGAEYIKRLVGLPGDRIQMKAGVLHINGVPVSVVPTTDFTEPYVAQGLQSSPQQLPDCVNRPVPLGGTCISHRARETLPNGVEHDILDVGMRPVGDEMAEVTVPPGNYFFMGDNRDNSLDSRFSRSVGGVGFVPFENLIGRADRIMFSAGGDSLLFFWDWRFDRFLKAVR